MGFLIHNTPMGHFLRYGVNWYQSPATALCVSVLIPLFVFFGSGYQENTGNLVRGWWVFCVNLRFRKRTQDGKIFLGCQAGKIVIGSPKIIESFLLDGYRRR